MTTDDHTPWDPGLQIERTALSWIRTVMSFGVAGALMVRTLASRSMAGSLTYTAITLPLAVLLILLLLHRHRQSDQRLRREEPPPVAALPAAGLSMLAVIDGFAGLDYVCSE